MLQALSLMEQAIARDPDYGPALAWAAYCCMALIHGNRSDDREADRRKGADFARRALEVAAEDPNVLVNAAAALAYFGEDIEAMMGLVARALTLNPSFAHGWYVSGMVKMWAGRPDDAINDIETARYLNPRARMGVALGVIGNSHFFARRFDEAVPNLLLTIQGDESYAQPCRALAACYAHMGRLEEARLTAARLRTITPVVMPDVSYLRRSGDRERLVSGLRLAAGEA
jgi:tetratricopeptide (TPR) repeat protein